MRGFGAEERSGDWLILATCTAAGEGGRCWRIDQGDDCLQTLMCFRVSFLSAEKKKTVGNTSVFAGYRLVMNKEMIEMEN